MPERGPGGDPVAAARAAELAGALDAVRRRMAAAATASGRTADSLTLVAVSKTRPIDDVHLMARLGVLDFGEARAQEGAPKAGVRPDLRWHFLGRLQGNKARSVGGWADVVHTVDRAALVTGLAGGAKAAGRAACTALVQVSLDGDPGRGGCRPEDAAGIADAIAEGGLVVGGVMAVAPQEGSAEAHFAALAAVAEAVRGQHPGATAISAGMSGDLEAAVSCGATHLRVGTALFGVRPAYNH